MIIQLILPSKPSHSLTRTTTDRAVVSFGAILVLLRVASEVGRVLDGDDAAWVRAVVSLTSRGRGGMTGCWGVAHWASRGAEGEVGSSEGRRLTVEASEVVRMWCFGDGSTIVGV
jgi:hypothetical protein